MNSNNPRVCVVIVSWNGKEFIDKCLSALLKQTYDNLGIIFVDNGSKDGSADYIRANYKSVTLLALNENTGFAKGNNIGIAEAFKDTATKYLVLLNIDLAVEPAFVQELVQYAETDPRIGACQPKTLLMDQPTIIDAVGVTLTKDGAPVQLGWDEENAGQHDQIKEVFGVNAGAALYRSEMMKEIGLFDEDFFIYYEDVDIVLRARLAGWKSFFVPKAVVFHKHSHAFGTLSPFKDYLFTRNQYYYMIKDLPGNMVAAFLAKKSKNIVGCLVKMALGAVLFNKDMVSSNAARFKAHRHAVKNIPKMFGKRRQIMAKRVVSDDDLRKWFV